VDIFRLIGLKPAVNSEHFRGASLTPLRGRAVELETLQRTLLDTAPGSPRVIGVSGPPGVGKSRLCFEFGEWCRERQIKVLEARAQVQAGRRRWCRCWKHCAPSSASNPTWTPNWRVRGLSRP
jgi:hypothetical protein